MKTVKQLTEDEAWNMCAAMGKYAPYLGYAVDIGNGLFVRRIKQPNQDNAHKGIYELCSKSPLNICPDCGHHQTDGGFLHDCNA